MDLGNASDGANYVFMMRDNFSDYKWFFRLADMSTANAATATTDRCSVFGVPKLLMSDGPTYFKSETFRLVPKGRKVPHHSTLLYFPWSNGEVERLGKELVRTGRAILSELQMRPEQWPNILPNRRKHSCQYLVDASQECRPDHSVSWSRSNTAHPHLPVFLHNQSSVC